MSSQILVIDDDPDFTILLKKRFASQNLNLLTAGTAHDGQEMFKKMDPDLVILDVGLPDLSGVELIKIIKSIHWETPVIMVSGNGETSLVVEAMKAGASDYVTKPVQFENLLEKVNQLLEMRNAKDTEKELDGWIGNEAVVGKSIQTKRLIREISKVAISDATVLLRGESGTGKSLVAEVIHALSLRKDKPFVTVNCAAIPETLLESELFGHEKGAFTGAIREKAGKFECANGGTIFMDEIGDLPLELQVKILRVLQGREFERVGGLKTIRVDVRVIAATNRVLEKAIQNHKFREDLFYRLNVLPIFIPPLRERKEDIPALVEHFFIFYSKKYNKQFDRFSQDVMDGLVRYDWPGNIRELQNVMERAIVLGRKPQLFPSDFGIQNENATTNSSPIETTTSLRELEYRTLIKALEQTSGNISKAARLLGIGRDTIYRRLKKYNIGLKKSKDPLPA